jgi:hypothetical protein
MQLIARSVFGVAVERVAGHERRFADAIQKLIAALRSGLRVLGDGGDDGRDDQNQSQRQSFHDARDYASCRGVTA